MSLQSSTGLGDMARQPLGSSSVWSQPHAIQGHTWPSLQGLCFCCGYEMGQGWWLNWERKD